MLTTSSIEIKVAPAPDWQQLLARKIELAFLQNIPSMEEHIDDWVQLAIEFTNIGLPAAASECIARVAEYSTLTPGEYVRLIEQPIAELVHVPEVV
jgi:hypothetical protein